MRPRVAHRYVAEIRLDDDGHTLTTPPLAIDWMPAVEWSHVRQLGPDASSVAPTPEPWLVRPQWDREAGSPYVAAIEVSSSRAGAQRERIPLKYLEAPVQRAMSELVKKGRINEGAAFTWRVCAFEVDVAGEPGAPDDGFGVSEVPGKQAALARCRLSELLRGAVHHGSAQQDEGAHDFPVLIASSVLEQADDAAITAGELETGGVLLGHLSRDEADARLVVAVTAQVPAHEAIAEGASLRFTRETWQAVHAAVELRRAGECIVGWWHSHPRQVWPCRNCPAEHRARCPSNRAFFSPMDVAFHRTAFPGALNVALLLSFLETPKPRHNVFGWWQGLIGERNYYVVEAFA